MRAISKAAEALDAGTLKDEGHGQWGEPFARLRSQGDWGDFVNNYFSCESCGQLFHLHAETYHGAGGAFEKVASVLEPLRNDSSAT